eukprot:2693155-Pyramimonas_sp.AAC.1
MGGIVTLPHWEIRQFYPWVWPPPRCSGFVSVVSSWCEYCGSPLLVRAVRAPPRCASRSARGLNDSRKEKPERFAPGRGAPTTHTISILIQHVHTLSFVSPSAAPPPLPPNLPFAAHVRLRGPTCLSGAAQSCEPDQ